MSNTPKPIFIIGIPQGSSTETLKGVNDIINNTSIKDDYHVLFHLQSQSKDVTFKVLNPLKSEEITLNELKEILKHKLKATLESLKTLIFKMKKNK